MKNKCKFLAHSKIYNFIRICYIRVDFRRRKVNSWCTLYWLNFVILAFLAFSELKLLSRQTETPTVTPQRHDASMTARDLCAIMLESLKSCSNPRCCCHRLASPSVLINSHWSISLFINFKFTYRWQ